jgi:hypothetical protein
MNLASINRKKWSKKTMFKEPPLAENYSQTKQSKIKIVFFRVFLGTSDPYLKCMHGQDKLFQTRSIQKTVNPNWDETFDSYIDNPFKPITFQVS